MIFRTREYPDETLNANLDENPKRYLKRERIQNERESSWLQTRFRVICQMIRWMLHNSRLDSLQAIEKTLKFVDTLRALYECRECPTRNVDNTPWIVVCLASFLSGKSFSANGFFTYFFDPFHKREQLRREEQWLLKLYKSLLDSFEALGAFKIMLIGLINLKINNVKIEMIKMLDRKVCEISIGFGWI